jgi:hypothetical protein
MCGIPGENPLNNEYMLKNKGQGDKAGPGGKGEGEWTG